MHAQKHTFTHIHTYTHTRIYIYIDEPDMQDTAGEAGTNSKRCTHMDPHTWPSKSRTTSTNIHSAAM